MSFFVFLDSRVKASVANCGTMEINSYWDYNRPGGVFGSLAMPNSINLGVDTHDFIGKIAPRAFFIIQGAHQWGDGQPDTNDAVTEKELDIFKNAYLKEGKGNSINTLLFDDNGGRHSFPIKVREQAYQWLDKHLKK